MSEFPVIRPLPPDKSTLTDQAHHRALNDDNVVEFDPSLLAIAMTTAPRALPTLEASLDSLRDGYFSQTVHLFAEPGTLVHGWSRTGVIVHQNEHRQGCYPNWLKAAQWLIDETDCPFLMILEDDGVYCRGAAAALYFGLTQLGLIGCISLYTPVHNYSEGQHSESGWFAVRSPDRWGAVALCFPRALLKQFLQQADWSKPDGTDVYIDSFMRRRQLRWYSHAPSLADHIGDHSTLGHAHDDRNAGIGFRSDFTGYQNLVTSARVKFPMERTATGPLISIILPVYNGEEYLRESIDSCLRQTISDWELILVDDGSTDGTSSIIRSYHDPRIVSIRHSVNRRLPAALNTGFRQSRGKFLTWTSCDNRYAAHALETLFRFLSEHPATDLVYSDFDFIDEHGDFVSNHRAGSTEMLSKGNTVGTCFLYRRGVYEEIGDYSDAAFLAEDYDYWLRARRKFRLTHLPMTLYEHRLHSKSLTSLFSTQIPNVARKVRAIDRRGSGLIIA